MPDRICPVCRFQVNFSCNDEECECPQFIDHLLTHLRQTAGGA